MMPLPPLPPKGLRAQIDRDQYRQNMQKEIRGTRGLSIREDSVEDLVIEGKEGGARPEVVGACLGTMLNLLYFLPTTSLHCALVVVNRAVRE